MIVSDFSTPSIELRETLNNTLIYSASYP